MVLRGRPGGVGPPSVNLGPPPPNISESTRARQLKFKKPLAFFAWGVQGAQGPHNINLGPTKISETTRARILKFKTQLDIVKYSLWVPKFLR